jgi:hypothetical protein
MMTLLRKIELYMSTTGTSPTRFGRESVRDPQLVFDMRKGRCPRGRLRSRINRYLGEVAQ